MKKTKMSNVKDYLNNFKEVFNLLKKKSISNKSSKRKSSVSFIKKLSRSDKYQKIIKIINQFKNDEIQEKKVLKKNKSSIFRKISNSNSYQKIIEKISILQNKNFLSSKYFKNNSLKTINNFLSKSELYINLAKQLNEFKLLKQKSENQKTNKKYIQKIGTLFYADHKLIVCSLEINLDNKIKICGITEIPIPGNVIGDSLVEDTNELANITLDSINLLDISEVPMLVILSSSFFTLHTFATSDLKQVSQTDLKVQSKSPYLPANTLVDFRRVSANSKSDEFVRTIYANKEFIDGWTSTLEIIDVPIIGLVPAAPHVFDALASRVNEDIIVLIDIESLFTTLLIGTNLGELTSHKVPFGSSLYISNDQKKSSLNYFERVFNSISLILKQDSTTMPSNIFVMGHGLDEITKKNIALPEGFKRISEVNLANYSYNPDKMEIFELVSKTIDSNIDSLATILNSCV
jgi:hypothetical protein